MFWGSDILQGYDIKKSKKESNRLYISLYSLGVFLIFGISLFNIEIINEYNIDTILPMIICFFIIISVNNKNNCIKYNKMLLLIVLLFAGICITAGFKFGTMGYLAIGGFYLLITVVNICKESDKNQFNNFIISITIAGNIIFFIILLLSMLYCPIGIGQYESFTGNANLLGYYSALGFICSSFILKFKKLESFRYLIEFIQASSFTFVIFTRSRTSLLFVGACISILLIQKIINKDRTTYQMILKRVIIIMISVFITYVSVAYVPKSLGLYEENKLIINEKEPIKVTEIVKASTKRNLKGIVDEGSFTSGRASIWQKFAKEIKITGHESGKIQVGPNEYATAHNAFLQVGYNFGIIGLIVYVLFVCIIWKRQIISFMEGIRKKKLTNIECFGYVISACFFISSILSSEVMPLSYPFALLFNMVVIAIVNIKREI